MFNDLPVSKPHMGFDPVDHSSFGFCKSVAGYPIAATILLVGDHISEFYGKICRTLTQHFPQQFHFIINEVFKYRVKENYVIIIAVLHGFVIPFLKSRIKPCHYLFIDIHK